MLCGKPQQTGVVHLLSVVTQAITYTQWLLARGVMRDTPCMASFHCATNWRDSAWFAAMLTILDSIPAVCISTPS